jgi:hypothetical protein
MVNRFESLGEVDEFRWKLVKSLLDEYPSLKERVKTYVDTITL